MSSEMVSPPFRPIDLAPLPDTPLVSVLMANYNYGRFLSAAAASVLAQSYARVELIICDDGSTDDSHAVIRSVEAQDRRVRAIYQANAGQGSALSAAFAASTGQIICLLDPDDLFFPDKVAKVVEALRSNPRAGTCTHQLLPVTAGDEPLRRPFPATLDDGWLAERAVRHGGYNSWPPTSGLSFRREVLERLMPIPSELKRGYCDGYLGGAAQFFTEFVAIPASLTRYRLHSGNTGSGDRPNLQHARHNVEYYELCLNAVRGVTARWYGEAAERLRMEDLPPWFWENALAMYLFLGKPREGVCGFSRDQILAHLATEPYARRWRLLASLPGCWGARMLVVWRGRKPWRPLRIALYGLVCRSRFAPHWANYPRPASLSSGAAPSWRAWRLIHAMRRGR